jgi:hypothetical protein
MENDKMLAIFSQTNHQILEKKQHNDGIELGTNPLRPPLAAGHISYEASLNGLEGGRILPVSATVFGPQ